MSVTNAIQAISSEAGRIDVLVNNAGYGLNGAFEDLAIDEIKAQYETNVFGLIRTTQAVLPIMRRQKSGTIVNISSGAGRFGFPSSSAYVSTKFAVEGLSESMSYELEPFGLAFWTETPSGKFEELANMKTRKMSRGAYRRGRNNNTVF